MSPCLEVHRTRIDPPCVFMDAPIDTIMPVLAELKANGKGPIGIIGLKVLGEGQLADRVDEAPRFAVTKDAVRCFTIGCESRPEFEGNFARIAKVSQPG